METASRADSVEEEALTQRMVARVVLLSTQTVTERAASAAADKNCISDIRRNSQSLIKHLPEKTQPTWT